MTTNSSPITRALPFLLAAAGLAACDDGPGTALHPLGCDVPALFQSTCAGGACHGADDPASGLDLVSPRVADRVNLVPADGCDGLLADPSDPRGSVLYQKVAGSPPCGAPMPLGGAPLTELELTCVEDWISGLSPPDPGRVCEPGTREACYTGTAGTDGVGTCHGGTRACSFDGLRWDACQDEVTPVRENCLASGDEDCDGAVGACSEDWSLGFGAEGAQAARSVAVDADGNVFLAADFVGTISFGGAPLVSSAKSDVVLAKYDRHGNYLWAHRFGDSSSQMASQLTATADGGVVMVGRAYGGIDFGGNPLRAAGTHDVFVVRFDADGGHLWSRMFGGIDADRAERVAVDAQGDVLVTGTYTASARFGDTMLTSAGLRDGFVVKLAGGSGDIVWVKSFGAGGDDYGFGIGAAANDDVLVTGRFAGTIDLGGPSITSAGGGDGFVARLTAAGGHVWSFAAGGSGEDGAYDLAVAPDGDVVVTGYFSGTADLGGGGRTSAGSRDIFVARYTGAGAHVFSDGFGDSADQFGVSFGDVNTWSAVAVDGTGGIWLAGPLVGSASFGGPTLTSAGKSDAYLVSLSASGGWLAGRRFGSLSDEAALDVAVAGDGRAVIAGRMFSGVLDFGPAGIVRATGPTSSDGFMAKLAP